MNKFNKSSIMLKTESISINFFRFSTKCLSGQEDDDGADGLLAVARRVEHQVEGGVEVVGALLETSHLHFGA